MVKDQSRRAFIIAATCVVFFALCASAGAAIQLELKLEKGRTYYERMTTDQRIKQTIMGQEQVIDNVIGVGQKLDVLDVDAQGNMQIRCTYIWSRFKQSGPMGIVDYDSSQAVTVPGGAEGFAALVGGSYTIRVSPKGSVLDVNGVKELTESVRKKVPEGTDISSGMSPVSFLISEDGIRQTTEDLLSVYPDKPVERGASWESRKLTSLGFSMITESKWTLQREMGGVATINVVSSMKSDPAGPPMDAQDMKMKIDVSGTQEGTAQVEEATGLIRMHRSTSLLKGQIGLGTSAEGPFDVMAIPITFETTAAVEMSDRKLDMGSK
jgi:hypothetical protein